MENKKVLLLESVYHDNGVRLIDLSDHESFSNLCHSHIKLVYRRLEDIDRDNEFIEKASSALDKVLDKKYGMHFFNFWRQSWSQMEINNKRSFHCAELVAKFYKMMGIITSKKGSSRYLPDSFSQSHKLKLASGRLTNEKIIWFSESDFNSLE